MMNAEDVKDINATDAPFNPKGRIGNNCTNKLAHHWHQVLIVSKQIRAFPLWQGHNIQSHAGTSFCGTSKDKPLRTITHDTLSPLCADERLQSKERQSSFQWPTATLFSC